jgi:ubiquinone/menaquinone biosynthesis C-methylase UbiE
VDTVYALGRSSIESERLLRQADELRPESESLLDRCAPLVGESAIDVGCGPRGILDLLSERVSPTGRVVGLDADPAHIELASSFVSRQGLHNVSVAVGDARDTAYESGSFDLVHARTLLINLPDPRAALTEMVRIARPGGWVVGLESDTEAAQLAAARDARLYVSHGQHHADVLAVPARALVTAVEIFAAEIRETASSPV